MHMQQQRQGGSREAVRRFLAPGPMPRLRAVAFAAAGQLTPIPAEQLIPIPAGWPGLPQPAQPLAPHPHHAEQLPLEPDGLQVQG